MKTIFKFFAAALAIVAAVSCAKDNNSENEPKMVHKVFSASLNEDETSLSAAPDRRTTLHTDGKTVHWTAGDEIALIPSESEVSTNFSIIEDSIDGTFADFEGDAVDADSYRAVYPANAYKSLASTKDVFAFYSGVLAKQYAVAGNFSQNSRTNCPNTNIAVSTTSHDNIMVPRNWTGC